MKVILKKDVNLNGWIIPKGTKGISITSHRSDMVIFKYKNELGDTLQSLVFNHEIMEEDYLALEYAKHQMKSHPEDRMSYVEFLSEMGIQIEEEEH